MTPKQKAIELLSQMPEPYKTWALENLEKHPVEIESEPKSISDAIGLFFWTDTPPGFKFWGRVQRHYQYGTPLPELPLEYRYEQLQKENEELKKKIAEFGCEQLPHFNKCEDCGLVYFSDGRCPECSPMG